jgi:hypothetical protein
MTEIEALGSFFYRRHDRRTETKVVDASAAAKKNVPFSRRCKRLIL